MKHALRLLALTLLASPLLAQPYDWHSTYTEDTTPATDDVVMIETAAGDGNHWVEFGNFRAALALTLADLLDVSETGADLGEALVSDGDGTWSPSAAPAMLTSTTALNAQIVASNVTQHQAALSITESQISDLAHTVDTDTTCNDAGVNCLFAASASEGGAAASGDSATAFFSAGTIEHERGGLEADVSAYAGLIRIAAGSTSAVTDLAGLNTALGSTLADGAHTTDTNAGTVCSGSLTYLDGEGGCDTYTLAGSTTELATVSGTTPSGECAEWDASGNLVTSGAACGGGGGAATAINVDGDATNEIEVVTSVIEFDPDDDGDANVTVRTSGDLGDLRIHSPLSYHGFRSLNDATLDVWIAGALSYRILASGLYSMATGGPAMQTATPKIAPNSSDLNTGFHADGSDTAWIVVGGSQSLTCDNDGSGVTCWLPAQASPPTCDLFGEEYVDTSGAKCWCDGAGAWTKLYGAGSCT